MRDYLISHLPKIINSAGLLLDVAGAALVWRFGLPETVSRTGLQTLDLEEVDEEEKSKAARYDFRSAIGFCLLIIGFLFQLLSNFV